MANIIVGKAFKKDNLHFDQYQIDIDYDILKKILDEASLDRINSTNGERIYLQLRMSKLSPEYQKPLKQFKIEIWDKYVKQEFKKEVNFISPIVNVQTPSPEKEMLNNVFPESNLNF